jgi:hypothetical protein
LSFAACDDKNLVLGLAAGKTPQSPLATMSEVAIADLPSEQFLTLIKPLDPTQVRLRAWYCA